MSSAAKPPRITRCRGLLVLFILSLWLSGSPSALGAAAAGFDMLDPDEADEVQLRPPLREQLAQWRHHFHANPELGNREFETAKVIAEHLRALDFDDVQTGIAHTGVVGILKGGRPGTVVALRADMDALPVTEQTGLPYASTVTTEWRGATTGVMHACGHDAHMAILMGVAQELADIREQIPGTVKFIFQPAEEGPPPGERGGAELMIEQGVLDGEHAPTAIFALHVGPAPAGAILVRSGPAQAASDGLSITVKGNQTHGSMPWAGTDPIPVAAQIVTGLQKIVARQIDITHAPAVVTIGSINGGNRGNIIPEEVHMTGTIRTFDEAMRTDIHERIVRLVNGIAAASGASASVDIDRGYPVTVNDPKLTQDMRHILDRASPVGPAQEIGPVMASEDFAYYAQRIPGLIFGLGVAPKDESSNAANHSSLFRVNDDALPVGVAALTSLALEYLDQNAPTPPSGATESPEGG